MGVSFKVVVITPISHPKKMIIFSRKPHGFVGEDPPFWETPHTLEKNINTNPPFAQRLWDFTVAPVHLRQSGQCQQFTTNICHTTLSGSMKMAF